MRQRKTDTELANQISALFPNDDQNESRCRVLIRTIREIAYDAAEDELRWNSG